MKYFSTRVCHDVVNGVITKCLNASKQKTKDKGIEIIMIYIEIEKQDIVQVDGFSCLFTSLMLTLLDLHYIEIYFNRYCSSASLRPVDLLHFDIVIFL